jgi:ribosomal protein S18 acetylase RimI-like enzyme
MIRLVPMTPEDLRPFLDWIGAEYASLQVQNGTWEEDEALGLAHAETAEMLPKGLDTPDQTFRVILDQRSGERVGQVWYCIRYRGRRPQLFVQWIGIDEKHRRRGYATAVFRELDREARRVGAYWVGLGVDGDNVAALSLYAKLGFKPKNIFLAKPPEA